MQKELFSKEKIKSLINDLNPSLEIVNINKFEDEVTIDLLIENFTHKSKTSKSWQPIYSHQGFINHSPTEIGRASCRERV